MKYSDKISINQQFQRSVQISTDIDSLDMLNGFVCPESSKQVLANMHQNIEAGQCAFTWTGPYGAGKSSLVLLLNALFSSDTKLHGIAKQKIDRELHDSLQSVLSPTGEGRTFIPVIGLPEDPVTTIMKSIRKSCKGVKIKSEDSDGVLDALQRLSKRKDGLILVVDEMGKFLDSATRGDGDIYIFQQLAEMANRSNGRIILVGVLHQSFNEYARSLTVNLRNEWSKIEGRFINLVINVAGEEQIALVSKAISSPDPTQSYVDLSWQVAERIAENKNIPASQVRGTLSETFPLHPITTCLLGPLSKRRFGQNQRSIFAFLTSAESGGFKEFITVTDWENERLYTPDMLYDYMRFNLEPSIMTSADASKWSMALEAINTCDQKKESSPEHIKILKTIVLLDMFMVQSGIVADKETLSTLFPAQIMEVVLSDLQDWKVLIFKRHKNLYALYEGSDFDIDLSIKEAESKIGEVDLPQISRIAELRPLVAKRHYHETGSLRWFDVKIMLANQAEDEKAYSISEGANGAVIIFLGDASHKKVLTSIKNVSVNYPILFTVAKNSEKILELVKDLQSYAWLLNNKVELMGDKVARREINESISYIKANIISYIHSNLYDKNDWYSTKHEKPYKSQTISSLNSTISSIMSDFIYPKAIGIKSELLNRDKPSASANTASNNLIKAMVREEGFPQLGFSGFPAEMGLYKIFLENTGIYKQIDDNSWKFVEPNSHGLKDLWDETDNFLKASKATNITIPEIRKYWINGDFGIKKGMVNILLAAYLKTREDKVAVYLQDLTLYKYMYRPFIDDLFIDYLLKNSPNAAVRWVYVEGENFKFLESINTKIRGIKGDAILESPLDTARAIVEHFDSLNKWTFHTREYISEQAKELRDKIKEADDPYQLLFTDIPELFKDSKNIADAFEVAYEEIIRFYPDRLKEISNILERELEISLDDQSIKLLHARAKKVENQKSDLRLSGFAVRLMQIEKNETGGIEESSIEKLAETAVLIPTHKWFDKDFNDAKKKLVMLCDDFRKSEIYTHIDSEAKASRSAISVIIGSGTDRVTFEKNYNVLDNTPGLEDAIQKINHTLDGMDQNKAVSVLVASLKSQAERG